MHHQAFSCLCALHHHAADSPNIVVLAQIIFNLVGNALKFTTEGYIRVSVKPLPAAGIGMDMVQLSVEDTGCGIAKDKQKLVFEAFGQVMHHPWLYGLFLPLLLYLHELRML